MLSGAYYSKNYASTIRPTLIIGKGYYLGVECHGCSDDQEKNGGHIKSAQMTRLKYLR